MTIERNKSVPVAHLILRDWDKVLLIRRKDTGYYDGWYSLPAGHVEAGELPLDALVRETEEELGIIIEKNDARLAHTMYKTKHDETGDRANYFFMAEKWSGDIINKEPHKCDDIQWFSLTALPESLIHHERDVLEYMEKGIVYSEYGLDRIIRNPSR